MLKSLTSQNKKLNNSETVLCPEMIGKWKDVFFGNLKIKSGKQIFYFSFLLNDTRKDQQNSFT